MEWWEACRYVHEHPGYTYQAYLTEPAGYLLLDRDYHTMIHNLLGNGASDGSI